MSEEQVTLTGESSLNFLGGEQSIHRPHYTIVTHHYTIVTHHYTIVTHHYTIVTLTIIPLSSLTIVANLYVNFLCLGMRCSHQRPTQAGMVEWRMVSVTS